VHFFSHASETRAHGKSKSGGRAQYKEIGKKKKFKYIMKNYRDMMVNGRHEGPELGSLYFCSAVGCYSGGKPLCQIITEHR